MTRAPLLCILLAGAACVTTNLPPLASRDARLEDDERVLWRDAEQQEKRFEEAGVIYSDPALESYVEQVSSRLAAASKALAFQFHVRVLKSPYLNAFTLPNGFIYVHAGMLARMDDEAQLAMLLSHEMTHAIYRHAAREFRDLKNKSAVGASLNTILPGLGMLGAFSSIRGYSRELETQADEVGFGMVAAAGYDLTECRKLFVKLEEEVREEKASEPFFFGTHPALVDRIENYRRLASTTYAARPKGFTGAEAFASSTRELVYEAARLDLQAGRFTSAERGAKKYAAMNPAAARGPFLLGEIARQRHDASSTEAALASYRKAIELDRGYAQPYRALGLLLLKRGEKPAAREALERYLELSPAADDRGYVEHDLEALR
jgi:predicted Zn-dependent protease